MTKETVNKYAGFVVSRSLGTAVDTAVLWLCSKYVFSGYWGEYIVSPVISFEVAVFTNFICSYYWIWRKRITNRTHRSFWRHFYGFNISSVFGFLVKMSFLLMFEKIFGWNVVICNLAALAISGILNYFLAEDVVFREVRPRPKNEVIRVEELEAFSPVFRHRWGRHLASVLLSFLGISRLNRMYDRAIGSREDKPFTSRFLDEMGCRYEIVFADRLKELPEGAFITISNHPYGGLDGIVIIDMMQKVRPGYRVMANDILSRAVPLRPSLITVNPTTTEKKAPTKANIAGVKMFMQSLRDGNPVGVFPAGAVSDLHVKDMKIYDREWQEGIIRMIKKAHVPVVPIYFPDRNSGFYYFLGLLDWRIRVLRLPRELLNKGKGRHRIVVGNVISPSEQDRFSDLKEFSGFLRSSVYGLESRKG